MTYTVLRRVLRSLAVAVSVAGIWAAPGGAQAAPLGTAFTYHGQLRQADVPVDGPCDLRFSLWDAETDGTQIGATQAVDNVTAREGLFSVLLDFGAAFDGRLLWLEIAVRAPAGAGAYTTLTPRQPLTSTPSALYAATVPWTGIAGVPASLADGTDSDTLASLNATVGQVAKWNGTAWVPAADDNSTSNLVAGNGLTLTPDPDNGTTTLAVTDGTFWALGGNGGTAAGTNFLGTTDSQPLVLKVNSAQVLRLEPGVTNPNLIGGHSGNAAAAGTSGVTIAGGGLANPSDLASGNVVYDDYGTIGGGSNNRAGNDDGESQVTTNAWFATVGGGYTNTASADSATVAGGNANTASRFSATVGGGYTNTASGFAATVAGGAENIANVDYATVGGGHHNTASEGDATVAGGYWNTASAGVATVGGGQANAATGPGATVAGGFGNAANASFATISGGGPTNLAIPDTRNIVYDDYGAIGGGGGNRAGSDDGETQDTGNATFATIAGGAGNSASAQFASVGGGAGGLASASYATVAGGSDNAATAEYATVAGGYNNVASANHASIGGGLSNAASGLYATVPGGAENVASATYTFAAGQRAKATQRGQFVWADSIAEDFSPVGMDTFNIRARGGFRVTANSTSYAGRFTNTGATGGPGIMVEATSDAMPAANVINDGQGSAISAQSQRADVATLVVSNLDPQAQTNRLAAQFNGDVTVSGTLSKSSGSFKIDHPLDPANKFLFHSFVESPDMKNVYDGVAVLDANGEAWVELPAWFEALNRDFRYQLTAVGGPGPNLHVADKVKGNRFRIAGGTPGLEVSWQVTGIRQDGYAKLHPIVVEQDKPAAERGKYLCPEAFPAAK